MNKLSSDNTLDAYIKQLENYLSHGYFEELKVLMADYEKPRVSTDPDNMFIGDSGEIAKAKAEADLAPKVSRIHNQLDRAKRYRSSGSYERSASEYTKSHKHGIEYFKKCLE